VIDIPKTVVAAIVEHARESFPEECCGFLIGSVTEPRRVTEARRARNAAKENRSRRYRIDPLELLHADEDARAKGLDLIGIYHSHPNHPAVPSDYDESHASGWYTYAIQSLANREPRELTAWRFDDSARRFEPEELRIRTGRRGRGEP
jgi:proteasome lid subunit RPN8/RPN11